MIEQIPLGYMGFSNLVIKNIIESDKFELKVVICPKDRINDGIISLCKEGIQLYTVSTQKEVTALIKSTNVSAFLMYKFPIIITNEICLNYKIFNIHPGDLRLNRGAHPIIWSILNGDGITKMSLYKLKEGIDLGMLIAEYKVDIADKDDSVTLENKMEDTIPLIINKLYEFLTKQDFDNEMYIENGIYLRKINESDYTINLESDSIENISRKIRSQKKYQGAILNINNKKNFVSGFDYTKDTEIITFRLVNNDTLQIRRIQGKEVEIK